ncbi:MAG TPA: hypothetical protein HA348_05355 [Thermoplasmata archaeon]|nr:hypothetical protein [Thermoplasmata archaeon]
MLREYLKSGVGIPDGAYQVAEKYLKDRKKRKLSSKEIEHYMEVTKTIERTREVQKDIIV